LNVTWKLPGTSFGGRRLLGGKLAARYSVISFCGAGLPERSIIVPTSSFQCSRV
jgi:hypothetical protein